MPDMYPDNAMKTNAAEKKIIAQRYQIEKILGDGGFSTVYLVTDIHIGMKYVAKHIKEESVGKGELCWLQRFSHPGIPTLHDIIWDEKEVYIIMEYKTGQTLRQILDREGALSEEKVKEISEKILDILIFLHSFEHPIAYGDLKPENIIIGENKAVSFIDFGSVVMAYAQGNNIYATNGYAAPEQLEGKICLQSDIYAFGKLLQIMLTGCPPEYIQEICIKDFLCHFGIKEETAIFISKCCEKEPEKRFLNAKQCKLALEDLSHKRKRKKKASFCLILFRSVTFLWCIMFLLSLLAGYYEWNFYFVPGILSIFSVTLLYEIYAYKARAGILKCEYSVCLSQTKKR